jgi:hypothetical protein
MTDKEAQDYIDSLPEMDMTPVNDLILQVLVKLRNNHPELDLNQKQQIRDALWKAWGTAYKIEYCCD